MTTGLLIPLISILDIYPDEGLLDYMVIRVLNFSLKISILFSEVSVPSFIPTSGVCELAALVSSW